MKSIITLLSIFLIVTGCSKTSEVDNEILTGDIGLDTEVNFRSSNYLVDTILNDQHMISAFEVMQEYTQYDTSNQTKVDEYNDLLDSIDLLINHAFYSSYAADSLSADSLIFAVEEAYLIWAEENVAGFEIFDENDECCAEALADYNHCKSRATRKFWITTVGAGIIVIGGVAIVVVSAGTAAGPLATAAINGGAINIAKWGALTESIIGAAYLAELDACRHDYNYAVLNCPCQCEWTGEDCP